MQHRLAELAEGLATLDLAQGPTHDEAMAAAKNLGDFAGLDLGLARFRGRPPWEKHIEDELLYVVDGSVEVTLLSQGGPERIELREGSLLVVPAGTWHRSNAAESVTLLFATPREGNESSFAEDPRG